MSEAEALVKLIRDSGAVGTRVHRFFPPEGQTFPYVTYLDPVAYVPDLRGDAATLARRRTLQVDLWQSAWEENDEVLGTIITALDGARVPGQRGYRFVVTDVQLIEDDDEEIVHHALTVRITNRTP